MCKPSANCACAILLIEGLGYFYSRSSALVARRESDTGQLQQIYWMDFVLIHVPLQTLQLLLVLKINKIELVIKPSAITHVQLRIAVYLCVCMYVCVCVSVCPSLCLSVGGFDKTVELSCALSATAHNTCTFTGVRLQSTLVFNQSSVDFNVHLQMHRNHTFKFCISVV